MTMGKALLVWFGLLGISAALVSPGHAQMAGFDADKPGVMRASLGSVDVKAEITKVDDFIHRTNLEIRNGSEAPVNIRLSDNESAFLNLSVRVLEMDASNQTPEIFVTQWTGGAHCCNEVVVISGV